MVDQQELLATHLSVLEGYRQRAEALPHTLHSARHYDGKEQRLIVLIRSAKGCYPLVVEPKSQRVISEESLDALNLMACSPGTPRAGVLSITVLEVLNAADEAVRQWCSRQDVNLDDVERVLALYLLPNISNAA